MSFVSPQISVLILVSLIYCAVNNSIAYGSSNTVFAKALLQQLESDREVKSSLMNLQSSISLTRSARGQFFPRLDLELSTGVESDEIISNKNFYMVTARAEQPIFDMRAYSNYKSAKVSENYQQELHRDVVAKKIFNILNALINYQLARKIVKLRQDDLKTIGIMLKQTNKRFTSGELAKTDVLQFESRYYAAQANLEQARDVESDALALLNSLSIDKKLSLIPVPTPSIPLNNGHGGSGIIKLSKLRLEVAKEAISRSAAKLYPTLSLKGAYSRDTPYDDQQQTTFDSSISINLRIPLFSGGEDFYQKRSDKYRYEGLGYAYQTTKLKVENDIRSLEQKIDKLKRIYELYSSSYIASKKNLRGVQREYRGGTKNSIDVLTIQRELIGANDGKLRANYSLKKLIYELLYRSGKLSKDYFKELR